MPAQSGAAIVLGYGSQGAQQSGAAIVLDYAPAAPSTRITASRGAPWGAAALLRQITHAPHDPARHGDTATRARWTHGADLHAARRAPWEAPTATDTSRAAPWGGPLAELQPASRAPWGQSAPTDAAASAPWRGPLAELQPASRIPWGQSASTDASRAAPWRGPLAELQPVHLIPWGQSRKVDALRYIPWTRYSQTLRAGWMIVTPTGAPPTDTHGTLIVPVRRAYIMINEATLTRVDDATALPVLSLSASTDADSWAWRVDVTLPAYCMDAVMPGMDGQPVLLQATINGHAVRWIAESVSRERSFGKSSIKVSGRSPSALLASPFAVAYSYSTADAISAQQAATDAITAAGLPLDWSIGWHITDWLLPGDLWQHQGTPLSAVQRIADAAGAYVQTDPVLQILHIRHRYPAAPWDWASLTPHVQLPMAVVVRESAEWVEKPSYTEVYVSGQSVGVLGHVVKTGTTGGLAASTVVDDLITHADAARQRGRAILGDTGRQQRITLSLPINDDTGLLEVGQLIDVTEGAGLSLTTRRGLVRSVAATYARPSARQTVEVETHV